MVIVRSHMPGRVATLENRHMVDYMVNTKPVFGSALFFMRIRTQAKIVMRILSRQKQADPDPKHCTKHTITVAY